MANPQKELTKIQARLVEVAEELERIQLERDILADGINDRIRQDALGEKPYPDKEHEADRGRLNSHEAKVAKLQGTIDALNQHAAKLEISLAEEQMAEALKDMRAQVKQAAAKKDEFFAQLKALTALAEEIQSLHVQNHETIHARFAKAWEKLHPGEQFFEFALPGDVSVHNPMVMLQYVKQRKYEAFGII